jgi:hypothetical protein
MKRTLRHRSSRKKRQTKKLLKGGQKGALTRQNGFRLPKPEPQIERQNGFRLPKPEPEPQIERQNGKRNLLSMNNSPSTQISFFPQNNVQYIKKIGKTPTPERASTTNFSKNRYTVNNPPHKENANFQQLVSSRYGEISSMFNTPEEMEAEILKEINPRVQQKLLQKLSRNYGNY